MRRHLVAIFLLPFMVLLVIPFGLLRFAANIDTRWPAESSWTVLSLVCGIALIGLGLFLLANTVRLFARLGQGTLAPWDPPTNLVIEGPYRHVRNPMISGVLLALLGECALLGSVILTCFTAMFFVLNHVYFICSEEKGLVARFGEDYLVYRDNVPRWLPRITPWVPTES